MHLGIGQFFCTDSHHENTMFDAGFTVDIEALLTGVSREPGQDYDIDWHELVEITQVVDPVLLQMNRKTLERLKKSGKPEIENFKTDEDLHKHSMTNCYGLRQEIIDWLDATVSPDEDGEKGWCMGSEGYRTGQRNVAVFFIRGDDAKAFIRRWSVRDQPTSVFDQNNEIRQVLNQETGELEEVASFQAALKSKLKTG